MKAEHGSKHEVRSEAGIVKTFEERKEGIFSISKGVMKVVVY